MKKQFLTGILAFACALSLTACGKAGKLPPSNNLSGSEKAGTDFQKNMHQSTGYDITEMCETDGGYYFEYNRSVYFMDKKTNAVTILCAKPECRHGYDSGCSAYIGFPLLAYYKGKLYFTDSDYVKENGGVVNKGERLFSMNLDGTNHDAVQNLDFTPGGDASNFVTVPIIHRGIVYFAYSGALYAVMLGDDIKNAVLIYGDERKDDGSNIINPHELYYQLWADGDTVYFMAENVKQANGTYKDILYSFNPDTGKTAKVWKVPEKNEVGSWDTAGVSVSQWYVSDGFIYFYLSGNDVWKTELSTGKTNKVIDLDLPAGAASFSDDIICIMNKTVNGINLIGGSASLTGGDTLYVYGCDGQLKREISLKQVYKENKNVNFCDILWAADGKIYIHADATVLDASGMNAAQVHYLYYAELSSGKLYKTNWSIEK